MANPGDVFKEGEHQSVTLVSRVEVWQWDCLACGASRQAYKHGYSAREGAKRHANDCKGETP